MPKFLIERHIPGVGLLPASEFRAIAQRSNKVLQELGPLVQWIESYVTSDRIHCVYLSHDEGLIREHALRGVFPADQIHRIWRIIDPATAE